MLALSPAARRARASAALLDLRARGFDLAVDRRLAAAVRRGRRPGLDELALRLWRLRREALRYRYERPASPSPSGARASRCRSPLEEVRSYRRHALYGRADPGGIAVGCALGVVGHAAARGGAWAGPVRRLGGALALLLALAVASACAALVPWSLFGVGALYAGDAPRRPRRLVARRRRGALLLAAELAYWAIEDDRRLRPERDVALRRAAAIAATRRRAPASPAVVVVAAGVEVGAGLPLAIAGAVAAAGLLVLVALLRARRALLLLLRLRHGVLAGPSGTAA